jgi:hypothetical protein
MAMETSPTEKPVNDHRSTHQRKSTQADKHEFSMSFARSHPTSEYHEPEHTQERAAPEIPIQTLACCHASATLGQFFHASLISVSKSTPQCSQKR